MSDPSFHLSLKWVIIPLTIKLINSLYFATILYEGSYRIAPIGNFIISKSHFCQLDNSIDFTIECIQLANLLQEEEVNPIF
jgi:hypothetical protein